MMTPTWTQLAIRWTAAVIVIASGQSARAADQVLSCTPQAAQGPDTQVLISEGMFGKGRILLPSPGGTVVYDIREKSSVSYLAEQAQTSQHRGAAGRLYINRLNGELSFQLAVSTKVAEILSATCQGKLTREECTVSLRQGSDTPPPSICFTPIDCSKLADGPVRGVEVSYKCKRSFKKF